MHPVALGPQIIDGQACRLCRALQQQGVRRASVWAAANIDLLFFHDIGSCPHIEPSALLPTPIPAPFLH